MTEYKTGPEIPATYKIGPAIVRIHGKPDQANLEAATARFLNKVVQQRRKQSKERSGTDERKTCV